MPGKHMSRIGVCTTATGNVVAGQVLYRFFFWDTQTQQHYPHGGEEWLVGTAKEWSHDVGVSTRQFGRAIKFLKDADYIEVRYLPHPRQPGIMRCSWVRLKERSKVLIDTPKIGSTSASKIGGTNYTEICSTSAADTGGTTYIGELKGELIGELGAAEAAKIKGSEDVKSAGKVKGRKTSKAKEPVGEFDSRQLEAWWRAAISEVYQRSGETYWMQPWSGKDVGNIKTMLKELPRSELIAGMDAVVKDWIGFVTYLEDHAGAYKPPDRPKIDTMFRYRQEMILFSREDERDIQDLFKGV